MPHFLTHPAVQIALACFLPSLAWLAYWSHKAWFGERRLAPVIIFFASGVVAGPIAWILFEILELSPFYEQLATIDSVSELEKFAYTLFAIGPIEEMSKFVVAWATLRILKGAIDTTSGALVFCCAAALGFATVENFYAMLELDAIVWHRALTLPFNHVLFSSFWGVGLYLAATRPVTGPVWLVASLVLSFVYHGLYDYILLSEDIPGWWVAPLILLLYAWLTVAIPRLRPRRPGPRPSA